MKKFLALLSVVVLSFTSINITAFAEEQDTANPVISNFTIGDIEYGSNFIISFNVEDESPIRTSFVVINKEFYFGTVSNNICTIEIPTTGLTSGTYTIEEVCVADICNNTYFDYSEQYSFEITVPENVEVVDIVAPTYTNAVMENDTMVAGETGNLLVYSNDTDIASIEIGYGAMNVMYNCVATVSYNGIQEVYEVPFTVDNAAPTDRYIISYIKITDTCGNCGDYYTTIPFTVTTPATAPAPKAAPAKIAPAPKAIVPAEEESAEEESEEEDIIEDVSDNTIEEIVEEEVEDAYYLDQFEICTDKEIKKQMKKASIKNISKTSSSINFTVKAKGDYWSGIEVEFSDNKHFNNSEKMTCTSMEEVQFDDLEARHKYYIRIRSFVVFENNVCFSKYTVKSIKTKK